jgi:hypothetical protein
MKAGELNLLHVERLDEIAPFIAKIRLGVSKLAISRYEESD